MVRFEAWVTTALTDGGAKKAIILAGSLRRVKTSKKLIALVPGDANLSDEIREKLNKTFDLVTIFEPNTSNGLETTEEWGKVSALSLGIFDKCVYLSPNTLVMKNCDEVFDNRSLFAAVANGNEWDTSVWLLTPKKIYQQAFGKGRALSGKSESTPSRTFLAWVGKRGILISNLDDKYNTRLFLDNADKDLSKDICIANFGSSYPLDMGVTKKPFGAVEMHGISLCHAIYEESFTSLHNELSLNDYTTEPIAVVGLSFRLPKANNVDEFWNLLAEGKEGIQPLPSYRWLKQHTLFPCKNRKVEAGFLNVPIDQFDAKFFGISPKDAEYLDPQQRLLHEISWEALEEAMIDPLSLQGTDTSIFVGSWIYDYQALVTTKTDLDFLRCYMGNSLAASAARLSHFYGTTGPSVGTESGCSAGIVAVDMAMKSLRNKTSNLALAGGVNLLIHPFEQSQLEVVVAPDNRCKTFDAGANGFGRAEGCAFLVMKRLSDAVRDGDNIWGLLRGSAMRQEGTSKSMGTPTVHSESLAMELALADAGVSHLEISYIETHGTGTPVGDPLEVAAITKAYSKGRTEPVLLGSVKTNVGHTESVSGITGIIKVLLSMKHEMIPKHLNLKNLNPAINLSLIPAEIPLTNVPWPKKPSTPRIAGVSSFGISGTDAHVIVEEPPLLKRAQPVLHSTNDRPLHILKISAKTQESLNELLQKYKQVFAENPDGNLANIAYTANTGRSNFNHRAVIIAKDSMEALKIIEEKSYKEAAVQSSGSKLCFLFTGQGSQYPNMASTLYATSPVFKYYFVRCDDILKSSYGISLKSVLWENSEELSRTLYSQTSIFVVEYCLLKLWETIGVKADYVLGHSLGEFAAAVAAGALTFKDALMLVAERSRLIDNLPRGKMLVIRADKKTVDITILAYQQNNKDFWVDYAAVNSKDQTVISGDSKMIEEFSRFCASRSLKTIVLAATHAFHSRLMDPMLEQYRKFASSVKPIPSKESAPLFISGMEGRQIETESIDADYWVRHTREKVSFIDACKAVQSEGCTMFLEVGPHPVLSAMAMMNIEERITCFPSIRRKENEWSTMLDTLGKLYLSEWDGRINWKGFDKFYARNRVPIPFYQFNRKSIWTNFERIRPSFHPLLGKMLSTAYNVTVFEKILTLKKAKYIEDHVIGNAIIFPGAGYLEMCLIGGLSVSQGLTEHLIRPRRPIILKKLTIASPLPVYDSLACRLQTKIALEDSKDIDKGQELGYTIGVHRSSDYIDNDGSEQGILHASARFLPIASSLPTELSKMGVPSTKEIQNSWESRSHKIKSFYEKTQKLGLRFGPKFQSVKEGWARKGERFFKVSVPDDHGDYLIHPILADAMFQAMMLWKQDLEGEETKLQVPVHLAEFIWMRGTESKNQFVYCSKNEKNENYSILMDEDGTALAYMKGLELIPTSVKLIEGILKQKNKGLPKVWKEVWKNIPGPLQNSFDVSTKIELTQDQGTRKILEEANDVGVAETSFYENIVQLTRLFALNALYKLDWRPKLNQKFTVDDIMGQCGISMGHQRYLRFFVRQFIGNFNLEDQGKTDYASEQYQFTKAPPNPEEVKAQINSLLGGMNKNRIEYRMISKIGGNLDLILSGKSEALSLLFPENRNEPTAADFYEGIKPFSNKILEPVVYNTIHKIYDAANGLYKINNAKGSPKLRILEVGAGSGTMSLPFLEFFTNAKIQHEYYFTDISSAFFISAEKLLKDHIDNVVFQKFDMEKDPLEQGFKPGYFDCIVACEVVHISEKMSNTLRNLRSLLKPGGIFLFFEHILPDPRITFVFGLLDGYWRCKDREHATLTKETWQKALTENDFENVSITPYYNNVHGIIIAFASLKENTQSLRDLHPKKNSWLVFAEDTQFTENILKSLSEANRPIVLVRKWDATPLSEEKVKDIIAQKFAECMQNDMKLEGILYLWGLSMSAEDRDQSEISLPFINLCQKVATISVKLMPRIFVVTQSICNIEPIDVTNPNPGTLSGIIRALSNEETSLKITNFDLPPNVNPVEHANEIFLNFWEQANDRIVAFRNGNRLIAKFTSAQFENNEQLTLPNGCERFQLVLPSTRVIQDLEYSYLSSYTLEENEVEVKVAAIALNFRDVFAVLKPTKQFEAINSVGLEFSGVITRVGSKVTERKVGDRVIGLNSDNDLSMPSHIKIDETLLVSLPSKMTFAEGATIPAVFITAVYCLLHTAKMKKGDTVLIHTASGGVGLCAIQLAKHVGANIIATAGSPRKRRYLHNLGIQHIFNSRATDFGKQILEVTEGRGVDIVLNSLTGEGFKEASLGALAKNGRFIEMSKLNVWSPEEVKELRPDVFYRIVDVTQLEKAEVDVLNETLENYLDQNIIKPIAYECFEALNIRGALNYLQKAKHIGKIICILPEVKTENGRCIMSTPMLNADSTYLVTGGLGGIGYEVVKRMLESGATHIAIVSRSKPNPEIALQIDSWNKSGKHVEAFSVDVGDFEQCQKLLRFIGSPGSNFPKLRGVMHAAGVLQDAMLENQNWSKFGKTYNPKVNGTWNLHHLTKDLQLEHFVLFSSIAGQIGSPGQSNHSSSNSFLDTFACYRRSNGLPATSINWGNWGEVGVAAELDLPGILPISTSQGLLALETCLNTQTPHMTVMNVESFKLSISYFPHLKTYVEDSRLFGETKSTVIVNSDDFWKEVDSQVDLDGKKNSFKKYIKVTARSILKMSQDEALEDTADFQSLGIDSLMMLEMRNGMQNILGSRLTLSVNQLKDCSNTEQLAQRLVEILVGDSGTKKVNDGITDEEDLKKLIREDCGIMPIIDPGARKVSEIKTVLLTGATGNMGPYILRDLSRRSEIQCIYCLVRSKNDTPILDRLQERLQELELLDEINLSKIVCIVGDITEDRLGLDEKEYETLADIVDAVIHLAARVSYDTNYSKDTQDKSSLRNVNVLGTVNVLELAGRRTMKHVLFPSTLMTLVEMEKDGSLPETWQSVGAFDNVPVKMSYSISKHVSEQIIRNVVEQHNAPWKVFRYPHIGGYSKTGKVSLDNNEVLLRWLAFMKLGCMPDVPTPIAAAAVDRCSIVTLNAFLNPRTPCGVYNVIQKQIEMEQELITIAEDFGIKIDTVPYMVFNSKLAQLMKQEEGSPFAAVKKFYDRAETILEGGFDLSSVKSLKSYWENSGSMVNKLKLSNLVPDFDQGILETMRAVMKRDLKYLKEFGLFEKLGIHS